MNNLESLRREEDRLLSDISWTRRQVINAKAQGLERVAAEMTVALNEEKAKLAKVLEAIEAKVEYVVKRDSDKTVIASGFKTYQEASEELSRIARDGEEEGWMYVWEVEVSPACICGPTKTVKQAIAPYCGEVCRRKAQDESLKRQNLRPTSWTDGNWAGE